MIKKLVFTFAILCFSIYSEVASYPDFTIGDISVLSDRFIHIKLENRSIHDCQIKPELNENIFLTIYINDLKRAEYKLKYMDKKLFKKNSKILFRTNFRVQTELKIKAEINKLKIIPESNYSNNTLEKKLNIHE